MYACKAHRSSFKFALLRVTDPGRRIFTSENRRYRRQSRLNAATVARGA
jgi:hypothetical protein